jgi:hypothetical protein
MTATPPFSMCGACREIDCECCDLLVWGGPCDCGCFIPAIRAPFHNRPVLIFLNKRYVPVPPRPKQRSHCKRGHKLSGNNVYQENASSPRRCWTCRRASWRKYQYRKAAAVAARVGEVA